MCGLKIGDRIASVERIQWNTPITIVTTDKVPDLDNGDQPRGTLAVEGS